MAQRFFVDDPVSTDRVCLAGDEAHHLARVMRAAVGDEVTLFDGSGSEFQARIVRLDRRSVELAVLCRRPVHRELPFDLILGVALPKGERQRWLVEKAVELGVTRLVPLVTARGVAQPAEQALERLRRTVVEASKQCGRNRLLQIDPPQSADGFLAAAPGDSIRVMAHPATEAVPLAEVGGRFGETPDRSGDDTHRRGAVYAAVGPEGGFTEEEVAAAQGWRLVTLGPRILRVETAALMLAAWFAVTPPSAVPLPAPSPTR